MNIHGFTLDARQTHLWTQGMRLGMGGDRQTAANYFLQLLAEADDLVPAALQAGYFLLSLDRYREARTLALRAAHGVVSSPELLLEITRFLRRFEEPRALVALIDGFDWKSIQSGRLLGELAVHLGTSGAYLKALELLDHAEKVEPLYAHVHYLRGAVAMFSGDMAASRKLLKHSLALVPDQPHVRWLLSQGEDEEAARKEVPILQAEMRSVARVTTQEAYLAYALHNSLHAVGRYEEAWQALERACAAKRALLPYRKDQQRAVFAALRKMTLPPMSPDAMPAGATNLVFIVGMHRSGTTLIERVLAGHSSVVDGGESYMVTGRMRQMADHYCHGVIDEKIIERAPSMDFNTMRKELFDYANWRANGRAWLTEKLPSNFLNLGFIIHALPEAKILHMRRDPMDTCFSNLRTYFGDAATYSYDQSDLADYYLEYQKLMAHWHGLAPGRILDVDYAAFVKDPGAKAREIMDFCGLAFEGNTLDVGREGGITATASTAHVRSGILGNRGEAWKPYASQLEPLRRGLEAAYQFPKPEAAC